MKFKFILLFITFSVICNAQASWKAKLFVHYYEDPTGKTITDTIWFGCDSLGADGYQAGLDVVDTIFEQNKTLFSDPLAQSQLGLPSQYNLKTNIKAFNKNGTVSYKLMAYGWVFALSWDTTDFMYEQPDFRLIGASLKCYGCNIGTWERYSYGIFGSYDDGTPTFGGRDSVDILTGNNMQFDIILYFKDTNTVGLNEFPLNFTLNQNPVHNEIVLHFKEHITGNITLTNNLGKVVYSSNLQNQIKYNFDVTNLVSGLYYLSVSNNQTQSKPIKILKL